MVAVPPDTGVIKPVEASTVATEVFDEDHTPPEISDENDVVELFEQISCEPLNVPATGAVGLMVIFAVTKLSQPFIDKSVLE